MSTSSAYSIRLTCSDASSSGLSRASLPSQPLVSPLSGSNIDISLHTVSNIIYSNQNIVENESLILSQAQLRGHGHSSVILLRPSERTPMALVPPPASVVVQIRNLCTRSLRNSERKSRRKTCLLHPKCSYRSCFPKSLTKQVRVIVFLYICTNTACQRHRACYIQSAPYPSSIPTILSPPLVFELFSRPSLMVLESRSCPLAPPTSSSPEQLFVCGCHCRNFA